MCKCRIVESSMSAEREVRKSDEEIRCRHQPFLFTLPFSPKEKYFIKNPYLLGVEPETAACGTLTLLLRYICRHNSNHMNMKLNVMKGNEEHCWKETLETVQQLKG